MNSIPVIAVPLPGPEEQDRYSIRNYLKASELAGAEPKALAPVSDAESALENLSGASAFILPGGGDVAPSMYGMPVKPKCGPLNTARDRSDVFYLKAALHLGLPILAVCRGFQLLNAYLGGTLIQDIPDEVATQISHSDPEWKEKRTHEIRIDPDSILYRIYQKERVTVNSSHHQALLRVADGLRVTAWAPDGIPEGYEHTGSAFILGTQFHPEKEAVEGDADSLAVFRLLAREGERRDGERGLQSPATAGRA